MISRLDLPEDRFAYQRDQQEVSRGAAGTAHAVPVQLVSSTLVSHGVNAAPWLPAPCLLSCH